MLKRADRNGGGRERRRLKGPAAARPLDWTLLGLLVMISGSAFVMIREAVETIPPPAVASVRLWIGAGLMYAIMRAAGRRFPALIVKTNKGPRLHLAWAWMLSVSVIGYTMPFFIFPWAQQYVESGLAGVYMAFMPLWTLGLAFLFANEAVSPAKLVGFLLGFVGVLILMGPDVIGGAARSSVLAQAGLLLATFGYGVAAVIMRRMPRLRPRVFTAGAILGAAVLATPALFLTDLRIESWTLSGVLSLIGLGVGPTGLAGLIIIIMIKRAGAGFMALTNYLVPIWAIVMGALIFHERLEPRVFFALAVILVGVAISQRRQNNGAAAVSPLGAADQTKI
ncbi:MAG: DMT family transporter [Parvularculaceae bacterium]